MEIYEVYEPSRQNFQHGMFSTREKAQAYIDSKVGQPVGVQVAAEHGRRYQATYEAGDFAIEEWTLDA